MLKYKAVIMTVNKTVNGNRFSKEVLENLAVTRPTVRVLDGSPQARVVGITTDFHIHNNCLVSEFETKNVLNGTQLYLVPAGICKDSDIKTTDDGRVIQRMELISLMLTYNPADQNLTMIERGDS